MIKLEKLLGEVTNAAGVNAGSTGGQVIPKAIILAGAPGAGKGYVLKGLNLGIRRIIKCHPFKFLGAKSGIDFVPIPKNKSRQDEQV